MRGTHPKYIYERKEWPHFKWDPEKVLALLLSLRFKQGQLSAFAELLGFSEKTSATIESLAQEILKSNEIEGEILRGDTVKSSIARKLGINDGALGKADRYVDGVVEITIDATQNFEKQLTKQRLFTWHKKLFPKKRTSTPNINAGCWRTGDKGPMQVVSGPYGNEKVHFQAPPAARIEKEMAVFIEWFNETDSLDPLLKSAIAHFWFITLHPFDDGNGRIARALADLLLAKSDKSKFRFYSISSKIQQHRKEYYSILEKQQKGSLEISEWITWYFNCLDQALDSTYDQLKNVVNKNKFWAQISGVEMNERQRIMINKLLDGFTGNLTTGKWAKICKCSTDTALRDINDLILKNILLKENSGSKNTSYLLKQ